MNFEGWGEISKQSMKTTAKDDDLDLEESLFILFKAKDYAEIVGLLCKDIERLLESGLFSNMNIGKASKIIKGTFNITIDSFEFIGQKFTSGTVGIVRDSGICVRLHTNLPFNEDFHNWIPTNLKKELKITLKELNEQKTVPQPEE
jgi:hypothetical protein